MTSYPIIDPPNEVERVSEEVGHYPGAWDRVIPDRIIDAAQRVLRAKLEQAEADRDRLRTEIAALRERCRMLREGMDSAYQSLLSAATYDQDDRPQEFIPYSSYDWRRRSMKQESIARDGALAAGEILRTDTANAMEGK